MRHLPVGFLILLLALFWSCKTDSNEHVSRDSISFTIEPAEQWTALFNRSQGWFGGDGIFAIPFSGSDSVTPQDSILFLFSDTMVGEIKGDSLQPGYTMINNSCMVLKGNEPERTNAKFLLNPDIKGNPSTLFVPKTRGSQEGEYYWLGDGFVNRDADKNLYIFAYRIRNTEDGSAFPFKEIGNALIVIPAGSKYPFKDHRQVELPFSGGGDSIAVSFGVGVHVNTATSSTEDHDGFVYIYGVRGKSKQLIAARTRPNALEIFSDWEFYKGDSWTNELNEATAIVDSVSNELSVTPIGDGKYALIYQYAGIMPTIYMQVGPSPVGPFGPRQKLWDTRTDIKEKDLFTYNAKAHPALSKPGELLVSYNVNSFNFFKQIEEIPNLYRPRFVRVVFNTK